MGCSNSGTRSITDEKPILRPKKEDNINTYNTNGHQGKGFSSNVLGNYSSNPNSNEVDEDIRIGGSSFVRESRLSIKSQYTFIEKLGSGAFGTVYKVKHKKLGHLRAVKVLSKEILTSKHDSSDHLFLKEIEILSKLDHPNIIKIFDYYTDKNNYYVVNELAAGGELYDTIVKLQTFSEVQAAIIMKQLLSAVYYLHSNNIVHRDIKPENILLESQNEGDLSIKLIDFGAAVSFTKKRLKEVTGTPYYIAPEVLLNSYSSKCDLWSCGVILYILLCGFPPFNGSTEVEILALVEKGEYDFLSDEWDRVSQEAKLFVTKLMTYDQNKRISAEEALKDTWLLRNATEKLPKNDKSTRNALENLKKFQATQKLQQASIAFIVHQMSTNEITKDLRDIFKAMDTSGDGRLTMDEIKNGYQKFFKNSDFSESEFENMMKNLDSDQSGYIEYEEFLRATIKMENVLTDKNLELAFAFFDEDKSGTLEPAEIKKALGISASDQKQTEVINKLIKEIDLNNDGVVSLDEFKELMKRVLDKR